MRGEAQGKKNKAWKDNNHVTLNIKTDRSFEALKKVL